MNISGSLLTLLALHILSFFQAQNPVHILSFFFGLPRSHNNRAKPTVRPSRLRGTFFPVGDVSTLPPVPSRGVPRVWEARGGRP